MRAKMKLACEILATLGQILAEPLHDKAAQHKLRELQARVSANWPGMGSDELARLQEEVTWMEVA